MSRSRPRPSRAKTTPQQRSDLARQAAAARWARVQAGQPAGLSGAGSLPGSDPGEPGAAALPPPAISAPKRSAKSAKRKAHSSWLDTRFCLQLSQDSAGEWLLRTPSGLDLPASPAEISLWLDLQVLNQRLERFDAPR